jgi:hypothetical protein
VVFYGKVEFFISKIIRSFARLRRVKYAVCALLPPNGSVRQSRFLKILPCAQITDSPVGVCPEFESVAFDNLHVVFCSAVCRAGDAVKVVFGDEICAGFSLMEAKTQKMSSTH